MSKHSSPFLEGTRIQFAWDSTSLTEAMACPLRYKRHILEGWQPKNPDVAIALIFGILIHSGVEAYHQGRAEGLGYDDAVLKALRHVTLEKDDFRNPGVPIYNQLPVEADIEQMKEDDDGDDADYQLRNSKIRTRYHLIRALTWYFEQYRQDHLKVVQLTTGKAAVEYSFRVPTGATLSGGQPLMLSGHFDKLVDFNGQLFVTDVKTTKSITRSYKSGFDLSHQMTGYTVGGKVGLHKPVAGVYIDAIQLQVGGVKFARFPTYRSESQLEEYLRMLKYVADQAEMWHDTDYYPQNTSACMFCDQKMVCEQPPEFRQRYLEMYYEQKPAWNPLASR